MKFAKVMFSQVSVCPQGGVCHTPPWTDPPGQTPPWPVHAGIHPPCSVHAGMGYTYPSLPSACSDTVNKRAVRIPLECILVQCPFTQYFGHDSVGPRREKLNIPTHLFLWKPSTLNFEELQNFWMERWGILCDIRIFELVVARLFLSVYWYKDYEAPF